ncbi:MAG: hypothetical protein AABY07_05070 [Nanoarchaeota archaeon]
MEKRNETFLLIFLGVVVLIIIFSGSLQSISGKQVFIGGNTTQNNRFYCGDTDGGIVPEV